MSRKICSPRIRTLDTKYVGTIDERLYPVDQLGKHGQDTFKKSTYSFSMVIDSFQGFFFRFPRRIKSLTKRSQT